MFPDNLKYTEDHEWALVEGDEVKVGITDYAQEELGDIVYVELPEVGDYVKAHDAFGVIESVKTSSDLYAPISGEIIAINEVLEAEPEIVNEDPYNEGWMVVIKASDISELDELMDSEEYQEYIDELSEEDEEEEEDSFDDDEEYE